MDMAASWLAPEAATWPQPLDLIELGAAAPTAPRFIVPDWLPAGYGTLLAGHGGAGKSGIALQLAAAIALGAPWCGIPTERRRVLYLSCEDRRDVLHWRLARIARHTGCDFADLAGWLHLLDLVGTDTVVYRSGGLTGAFGALDDMMRCTGAEVVFVDGASDTFAGSEISRAEVKGYVNALLGLIPQTGAVLLVAHVDKATARSGTTSEGYSGSTAWHNAVRSRLYLRPETAGDESEALTSALVLECQKSNLARAGASIRFAWNEDAHLFLGSPVAQMCGIERKARDEIERQAILLALRGCGDEITVPSAATGPRTALHVLAQRPEFPSALRSGAPGKRRFWAHLEAMRQMRLVEESTYRRDNRHVASRLTLTAQGLRQCAEC
ncbi:Regulatory protein RepA [Burkholderiales bacterium]|nr:Regulatory protein RepA [Burkholderiales bacterium]